MDAEPDAQRLDNERNIAHTGALARWAGHCAHHPWRVVLAWLGIVVVLIGLNTAFHGKLVNDFKIPGSDTQKATDLINAKFGGERGAALRVVVAAPDGESLNTPERKAAIEKMLQQSAAGQKTIDTHAGDARPITNPLDPSARQFLSKNEQIGFFDVQFDQTGLESPVAQIVALEDQFRATGAPAGVQVEFTGEPRARRPSRASATSSASSPGSSS